MYVACASLRALLMCQPPECLDLWSMEGFIVRHVSMIQYNLEVHP